MNAKKARLKSKKIANNYAQFAPLCLKLCLHSIQRPTFVCFLLMGDVEEREKKERVKRPLNNNQMPAIANEKKQKTS